MLRGGLPFPASAPMEWVHCHIARRPAPPAERREDVPGVVSAIVLKVLAKTPEERYQTAAGVERDLRRCLRAWEAKRPIDDFPLGEDDTPDRLLVPEKLYGRSREFDTLLAAFSRLVTSGKPELVLVSGYSGIGKSSVVNELHKVLVPPRGLFANPVFRVSEFWYWTRKAQARFLAGNYPSAVDASSRAHRLVGMSPSFLETAECHFYGALSRAASWDSASPGERRQHLEALTAHHGQLQAWAELCPENFENRAALVGAEVARIEGRVLDAERLYEKAIRSAHINGFIHNEAVACEVAARFYAARGFDRIADVYLRDARYGYLRWGADGKVRQLDEEHPHLGKGEPAPAPKSTIGAPVENLELATVLKVSQAVSGEIVLEKLIDTLLRTAIEHAGAERGLLILLRGGELSIEAEANTSGDSVTVRLREASIADSELPESIVHYAARTQESVILGDASAPGPFSGDAYIRERRARSVLCLPLVKQGRLVALLYLENSLAFNVFTPARTAVLKVLASQAAMALENGRLYRELQERESKIRRLVDANIVGVVIVDQDSRVIEANNAYLDMVGCTRDDLVLGRVNWMDLTPPEWMAVSQRAVEQLRATGSTDLFEKEYLLKDGTRVPVLVAAASITPTQAVAFVVDLRDRKATEEALLRAREELARVTRVSIVGELTASIAHEINQPLAAVATYAGAALLWLLHDQIGRASCRERV